MTVCARQKNLLNSDIENFYLFIIQNSDVDFQVVANKEKQEATYNGKFDPLKFVLPFFQNKRYFLNWLSL